MASNESDLINAVLPWVLGFMSIFGAIYASFKVLTKYFICKGKNQEAVQNWKNLIEGKLKEQSDDIEDFKKWAKSEHEDMNANVEKRFDELSKVTKELSDAVAETNGYLKRLAEEKN